MIIFFLTELLFQQNIVAEEIDDKVNLIIPESLGTNTKIKQLVDSLLLMHSASGKVVEA